MLMLKLTSKVDLSLPAAITHLQTNLNLTAHIVREYILVVLASYQSINKRMRLFAAPQKEQKGVYCYRALLLAIHHENKTC